MTNEGGNFDGQGRIAVDIRAVHDGIWAYFLFIWEDPTRSLKQTAADQGNRRLHVLHNGHESGDEHDYNEDKFSVAVDHLGCRVAGDKTFHGRPASDRGAPATMTGRGLHFTADNRYVDVWQWKATSGGPPGGWTSAHFGPPLDRRRSQARNVTPYRGGFAPDPGTPKLQRKFHRLA